MAKVLGLKVIAEGVENEAQLLFLAEHMCDEVQGYYFSRPLNAQNVERMLRKPLKQMKERMGSSIAA
jgi:EAL domain-containing protein (putative c-di-GMP-specific phosphodiesterase class I)